MKQSKHITVFTGRFGSGKTEISLNYALHLANQELSPLLVDLDLVTPYFRTRDKAVEMARRGVETIAPFEAGRDIDVPAISPRILGAIEQSDRPVVIDLGGDRQGTRALAQYAAVIGRCEHAMHFVVNPYRPFMDTVASIRAAVQEIEASSGLQVSALVSNPNLMSESTPEIFLGGHRLVEDAGQLLKLPIAFAVVSEALSGRLPSAEFSSQKVAPNESPPEAVDRQTPPLLVIHRFFLMFDTIP